jgi:hypothetical protein
MKKSDYKFYRDKKLNIEYNCKETQPSDGWFNNPAANRPIFIPKRKKKK